MPTRPLESSRMAASTTASTANREGTSSAAIGARDLSTPTVSQVDLTRMTYQIRIGCVTYASEIRVRSPTMIYPELDPLVLLLPLTLALIIAMDSRKSCLRYRRFVNSSLFSSSLTLATCSRTLSASRTYRTTPGSSRSRWISRPSAAI